jgi:hypothetical protein
VCFFYREAGGKQFREFRKNVFYIKEILSLEKGDRKMLGYKSKRAIFFNGKLFCHPISSSSLVKANIFKSERNAVIWELASLNTRSLH